MTFKRVLLPIFVLGLTITMGSMAFGQTITCSIANSGAQVTIGAAGVNDQGATTGLINSADLTAAATVAGTTFPAGTGFAVPGPSARATNTGHTEPVGAGPTEEPPVAGGGKVRVTCTSDTDFNPGVLVLTVGFGVPITNNQTFPAPQSGVRIMNGTGAFIAAGPGATATSTGNTSLVGPANATCATTPVPAPGGPSAGCPNVGISAINNSAGTIVIGLGNPVAYSSKKKDRK